MAEGSSARHFSKMLSTYKPMRATHFTTARHHRKQITEMLGYLEPYNTIIVDIHGISSKPARNYGITTGVTDFVNQLKQQNKK